MVDLDKEFPSRTFKEMVDDLYDQSFALAYRSSVLEIEAVVEDYSPPTLVVILGRDDTEAFHAVRVGEIIEVDDIRFKMLLRLTWSRVVAASTSFELRAQARILQATEIRVAAHELQHGAPAVIEWLDELRRNKLKLV